MKSWIIIILMSIIVDSHTEALRILGIFPLASKSHFNPNYELMKGLARRGHQVDVVSHFPLKKPMTNYKDISLEGSTAAVTNNLTYGGTKEFTGMSLSFAVEFAGTLPCNLLSHQVFQKLLEAPKNKYDVVVVEICLAHCYIAFGQHFNVPLVGVSISKVPDWLLAPFGIPFNTAYVPSFFLGFDQNMTFLERLKNTIIPLLSTFQIDYHMEAQREHVEKYFGRKLSSMSELYADVALLLVNSHHSLNGVVPMPPGVIEVGGLHVHDDQQQLSSELKEWLDDSKHGCIYISFGSMVRIETFPPKILLAFYEMFERVAPVRVLMKVVDPKLLPPGLPNNVMTSSWLPQVPVLGHKNVKIFITHGGLMGTQESIAFGVPMVGIPLFGDQPSNIKAYEKKKIAIGCKLEDLTGESLTNAVTTILNDPIYRDTAKRLAVLFHDRPMSALDTAVYWIEYAARHGNVLQSPAGKLTWWRYHLIDVYGFMLISLLVSLCIIRQCFRLSTKLFHRKERPNSTSNFKKIK